VRATPLDAGDMAHIVWVAVRECSLPDVRITANELLGSRLLWPCAKRPSMFDYLSGKINAIVASVIKIMDVVLLHTV